MRIHGLTKKLVRTSRANIGSLWAIGADLAKACWIDLHVSGLDGSLGIWWKEQDADPCPCRKAKCIIKAPTCEEEEEEEGAVVVQGLLTGTCVRVVALAFNVARGRRTCMFAKPSQNLLGSNMSDERVANFTLQLHLTLTYNNTPIPQQIHSLLITSLLSLTHSSLITHHSFITHGGLDPPSIKQWGSSRVATKRQTPTTESTLATTKCAPLRSSAGVAIALQPATGTRT